MATRSISSKSKEVFVGREAELKKFTKMLNKPFPKWILHIGGAGGLGKTKLLEEMLHNASQRQGILCARQLIDFYFAANRTERGLLEAIAAQLGADANFPNLVKAREQYERVAASLNELDEQLDFSEHFQQAFQKDYEELLRHNERIVLFLDTCEELHGIGAQLLRRLQRTLNEAQQTVYEEDNLPNATMLVLAGRPSFELPEELRLEAQTLLLKALSPSELLEFFRQGKLNLHTDQDVQTLQKLSSGQPLYVALIFDWLNNEVGTLDELLQLDHSYSEELVHWILRLEWPQARAILYTALAWRRMEPSLLARLLQIPESETRTLIDQINRYSFVKSSPLGVGVQLQDEMRDLLMKFVWPGEGQQTEISLLNEVIAWYEEKINDPVVLRGESVPREEELFSLIAEWCYYRCRVDVPATVPIIEAMFRQAIHLNQFGFCSLLNAELARFRSALTPAQQDRLDFRTGLVYFRLDEPRLAQELWLKLINFSGIESKLRATTLLMLTELIARSRPDDAIEYGKEAEQRYQTFIEQESDQAAQQILIAELGQVYNNLGFAYRVKGDLPTAIHYYELALKHSKRPKNIATTLNNIGYAYFLMGDWVRARVAVGQSLQYREKLQIKHELGLGYNTMGIMLEQIGRTDEASDYYQRALRCFDEFTNRRGRSMVYVNLGRFNRHAKNFDLAFKYLERARKDMTYINDFDQLIIVLNELGCACRDRNQPGDWTKAEDHLASSLSLARQLGNLRHQADNLEDLSQLYLLWGQEARVEDDTSLADELESKAIDVAQQADALAVQLDYHFMKAKVANTFGDIALSKGQTDTAFDHYFGACRAMLDAHLASVGEPLQLQRWTDEIVDNLQKHLSALGTARETQEQANRLLRALDQLSDQEKDHAETLSAMLSMSAKVSDTFDAFL